MAGQNNDETEIIPEHTRKESILIIASVLFAIFSFAFLKGSGIKFTYLFTPINSFNNLINNEISINYAFLVFAIIFLSLSLSFTLLFSLVKEKKKLFLFIIPPAAGIAAVFFFGPVIGMGVAISYFIIEYLVSKDKSIFKKISLNYLVNHAVGKALLVINISIALATIFILVNNTTYAKTEINNLMATNLEDNITIDNMDEKMISQQKEANMVFANSILDSVETAFSKEPVCRNAMTENRQSINDQIESQVDSQLSLQKEKFENIEQMINTMIKYYPYLTAITIFAFLQLFNVLVIFAAKTGTIVLYRFLKNYFNFSIS